MRWSLAGFVSGCLLMHTLPGLPGKVWVLLTLIIVCVLFALLPRRHQFWRYLLMLPIGLAWSSLQAQLQLHDRLPADTDQILWVSGTILRIPEVDDARVRFLFAPRADETLPDEAGTDFHNSPQPAISLPRKIQVDWYRHKSIPQGGEQWRLLLRIRPPHGPLNHYGYDAERNLLVAGIGATAVVRDDQATRLHVAPWWSVDALRWRLAAWLSNQSSGEAGALLRALLLGDRSQLSSEQWQLLRRTGTGHLVAISGLHVALVAGLGYFLARGLWWLLPALALRCPAPLAGVWIGLLMALAYAVLAGLFVSTQRALIMLAVAGVVFGLRRTLQPWVAWWWALALILAWSPSAALSAGLWLSFGAVAILLYGFVGRSSPGAWQALVKAQILVSVGLLPLSVYFFQQFSLVGPLANLAAVPAISLLILPLALGALSLHLVGLSGELLLKLAGAALEYLMQMLAWLAAWPLGMWQGTAHWAVALAALIGVAWLLAPRGIPMRPLALAWFLPLFFTQQDRPGEGDFELYQFDVGQGLAVAIRTRNHLLLYDTGPGDGAGRDWLAAAVAPLLHHWGAPPINHLIISHRDLDHAGGRASAARLFAPEMVSEPNAENPEHSCQRGTAWQWDGVAFEILHPGPFLPYLGNDSSCVLRVRGEHWSVLLPGDLGRQGESQVIGHYQQNNELAADVLLVGHHGSRSSTSAAWLSAIRPGLALISRGRYNRFGFPHEQVVQRLRAESITVLDSAHCGGLWLRSEKQPIKHGLEEHGIVAVALKTDAARVEKRWWRTQALGRCQTQ